VSQLQFNIIILLTASCFWNCTKIGTEQEDFNNDEINIYYGSFGGWCISKDSLSIFSNLDTHFKYKDHCTDADFETSQNIEQGEYNVLLNSFSRSEFESLTYNSCARCSDGIDHFLYIVGSNFSHRIVYSSLDNIEPMENFVMQLDRIKEDHQAN